MEIGGFRTRRVGPGEVREATERQARGVLLFFNMEALDHKGFGPRSKDGMRVERGGIARPMNGGRNGREDGEGGR